MRHGMFLSCGRLNFVWLTAMIVTCVKRNKFHLQPEAFHPGRWIWNWIGDHVRWCTCRRIGTALSVSSRLLRVNSRWLHASSFPLCVLFFILTLFGCRSAAPLRHLTWCSRFVCGLPIECAFVFQMSLFQLLFLLDVVLHLMKAIIPNVASANGKPYVKKIQPQNSVHVGHDSSLSNFPQVLYGKLPNFVDFRSHFFMF